MTATTKKIYKRIQIKISANLNSLEKNKIVTITSLCNTYVRIKITSLAILVGMEKFRNLLGRSREQNESNVYPKMLIIHSTKLIF